MPEQLPELPEGVEPPFDPEFSPLTYGDLVEDPNFHPAMKPHAEHWAAKEAPEPAHNALQPRGDSQAELTVGAWKIEYMIDGVKEARDNNFDATNVKFCIYDLSNGYAEEAYKDGTYTTQRLADLLHAAVELQDRADERQAEEEGMVSPPEPHYGALRDMVYAMPARRLREMYFSEDKSADLKKVLNELDGRGGVRASLLVMQKIYGRETMVDLATPGGVESDDPLVQKLLQLPEISTRMIEQLDQYPGWPEGMSPSQETAAKRIYADKLLMNVLGLPSDLSSEIQFASLARTTSRNGYVYTKRFKALLEDTAKNVQEQGVDNIVRLRKKAGIVNLEYYTKDDLDLMSEVIKGKDADPEIIKHLQDGDVTVVFTDAKGGHNEAFRTISEKYATKSKRTLFFEINERSDFYRHMILLKEAGIKPSTLVVATHGEPGGMGFGEDQGKFSLDNDNPGSPLVAAEGIPRIVDEFMQDSRGIDDNPEAIGRRRIILNSCSQAKKTQVKRFAPQPTNWRGKQYSDTPVMTPLEKVQESSAETLVKAVGNPNVDVYAAPADVGWYRTEEAVGGYVNRSPAPDDPDQNRTKRVSLIHSRLGQDGTVIESQVEEIVLRRVA